MWVNTSLAYFSWPESHRIIVKVYDKMSSATHDPPNTLSDDNLLCDILVIDAQGAPNINGIDKGLSCLCIPPVSRDVASRWGARRDIHLRVTFGDLPFVQRKKRILLAQQGRYGAGTFPGAIRTLRRNTPRREERSPRERDVERTGADSGPTRRYRYPSDCSQGTRSCVSYDSCLRSRLARGHSGGRCDGACRFH